MQQPRVSAWFLGATFSNLRTSLLSFGFSSFSQARLPNLLICLESTGSTLWSTNIAMARKSTEFWWYIPGQNVDFPWRYVSLPEGVLSFSFGMFSQDASHVVFSPNPKSYEGKKSSENQKRRYQGFWMMRTVKLFDSIWLMPRIYPPAGSSPGWHETCFGLTNPNSFGTVTSWVAGIDPTYDPSFQMFSQRNFIFLWDVFVPDFSGECFWGCVRFDSSCCKDRKDPRFLGCFIVNQS